MRQLDLFLDRPLAVGDSVIDNTAPPFWASKIFREDLAMKSRDFCYWLQGYFELAGEGGLTPEQVKCIRAHLNMVFVHEIDPSFPAQQQSKLNQAHWTKPGTLSTLPDGQDPIVRC